MPKISKIIDQELVKNAEEALNILGNEGVVALRLKAIIASYKHGIKKVSEVYDINRSSLHRWVVLFKNGGSGSIKNIAKPSRSKLSATQKSEVKSWIDKDSNLTIKQIKIMIKGRFNVNLEKSSIHRMIHDLGFSHITGRKKHYKSNQLAQEEFKKKS